MEFAIADNKDLYKLLYEKKDAIEATAEAQLDWRELPDRKMSRILYETGVDFSNKELLVEFKYKEFQERRLRKNTSV